MVTPGDLLELAAELGARNNETAIRSAASRAYYAAFWHCRAFAESRFHPLDEYGPEVHIRLIQLLALWDEDAAERLSRLRRMRNVADYEPDRTFHSAWKDTALADAATLLEL